MKTIPNHSDYKATECGKIYSTLSNKFLKPSLDTDGYEIVSINGKNKKVHRLIALTYIGESWFDVHHINGNRTDNRLENLEYISRSEHSVLTNAGGINTRKASTTGRLDLNWQSRGVKLWHQSLTLEQKEHRTRVSTDHTIYEFLNLETGETFIGKRKYFQCNYGLASTRVSDIINIGKTRKGWILL